MLIAELLSQTAVESIKDLINSISRPAPFFLGSFVLLGIALSSYRWLTKPEVGATGAGWGGRREAGRRANQRG